MTQIAWTSHQPVSPWFKVVGGPVWRWVKFQIHPNQYFWQFWAFNRSCVVQLPCGNEHSPILISQLPGLE